jgi:hypothetical protein
MRFNPFDESAATIDASIANQSILFDESAAMIDANGGDSD